MAELILRTKTRQAQYFTEDLGNGIGLDMILVKGGKFMMGSPEDELERSEVESPIHSVIVPTFFIGRYPVTQSQWRAVAAMPQVQQGLDPAPSSFKGDMHPAESVSWYDAVEFCARLAAHTKRPYRLPSEAEWEYACRAGTTTPFYFGNTIRTDLANYNGDTYAGGPKGEYRGETTPVDHFKLANSWGLLDMHGNIDEWCQDQWHGSYKGAPEDGSAWVDQTENQTIEKDKEDVVRVVRGGSWYDNPRHCRSAFRDSDNPSYSSDALGFRVVYSMPNALS